MSDSSEVRERYLGPQLLEALLNSAVGAIITIDEQGIVQGMNPATEQLFGYPAGEIVGRNVRMLMPEPHRSRHDGYLRHHIETGERRIIGIGREVEGQRKDGSRFPMHLSVSAFRVDGRRYFAGIVHDLTARDEAKAESSKQQSLFKTIFDNVPDAMIICDSDLRVSLCNTAVSRVFGYVADEVVGRTAEMLYESGSGRGLLSELRGRLDHGPVSEGVTSKLRRNTGEQFPGTTQGAHIVDDAGRSLGYLLVIRDLSIEVAREQALRKSQRMESLGQLTGGIAHDFNNLLTIITGNHELLEGELGDEAHRDLLRRANSAAMMGARLTSRLLTFARRRPLDAVLLDLNEQVLSMLDLLRRTLGEQVELSSILAPNIWPVRSDPSEIENAVLNLAINARDAMPNGGRLFVETRNSVLDETSLTGEIGVTPGEYVCLSVSDTGCGMSPEVLARVFEPFFTTKETGKGTGLGLSVVYGFARQSGGIVTIYSELDRGTTVNLYLPRADAEVVSERGRDPQAFSRAKASETVLVVEDQAQVREVTLLRLIQLGYTVIEAENGPRAIEILEAAEGIDLVFSDVVMPGGMSGFDLARWISENKPGTAVVLTSGFADDVVRAGWSGAAKYNVLRKPYGREELARALREAIGRDE